MQPTVPSKLAAVMGGMRLRLLRILTLGMALTCLILVSLIGIGVGVMPVSLLTRNLNLAPAVVAVYGSARAGKADLAGGYQLSWSSGIKAWGPHLSTEFVLAGGDTQITGRLRTGLLGIGIEDASGRAGPGLAQLVPGAWRCDMTAVVSDVSFGWRWRSATASGGVTTREGSCSRDGRTVSIPPLALTLTSAQRDALVTLTGARAAPLATVRVGRDRIMDIAIQPAAADVFPQLPRGGPINLQLPF